MPTASLQPCAQWPCRELVPSGRCKLHARAATRYRGTTAERGYDARWDRLRKVFLRQRCGCANVLAPLLGNPPDTPAIGVNPQQRLTPRPGPQSQPQPAPPGPQSQPAPRSPSATCLQCSGTGLAHAWCAECGTAGVLARATQIDHIWPFREYGPHLRLDQRNLQGLCATCHSRKSAAEQGHGEYSPYQLAKRAETLAELSE